MNRITYKNKLTLLAVLVMLMATLLIACGSKAVAPSTEAETTKVETAKAEETEPVAPEEVEEVVEAEPTAEPTPEPVVYEGIDMESTLPGLEWIQTFDGVFDEPKLIIFNDSTNRKQIVENGDSVEYGTGDTLAIYSSEEIDSFLTYLFSYPYFSEMVTSGEKNNYVILDGLNKNKIIDGNVSISFEGKCAGQDVTLYATLLILPD